MYLEDRTFHNHLCENPKSILNVESTHIFIAIDVEWYPRVHG
jgi:hypothetical protein